VHEIADPLQNRKKARHVFFVALGQNEEASFAIGFD